jgi:hypothetical protein
MLRVAVLAFAMWPISPWRRPAQFDERAMIEEEVANGWNLSAHALPSTLSAAERAQFALTVDKTYLRPDITLDFYTEWHGIVVGGAAWEDDSAVRS